MKTEIELLTEIDNLYNQLLEEPFGRWRGSIKLEACAYNYTRNAVKLKDTIYSLYNEYKPQYLDVSMLSSISHTCEKEVSYVQYHYDESRKSNAAKKRHTEFISSISKANDQIKLDLYAVFTMIKEMKESDKNNPK